MDKMSFIDKGKPFLKGAVRSIDLFGSLNTYGKSDNPQIEDAKAIQADWAAVMNDLALSIESFESILGEE